MKHPFPGTAARIDAPAKVNLALRILERRSDGYHELDTIFQAVSLVDTIELTVRDDSAITLSVSGADVGPLEDNLAVRAARGWSKAAGVRTGFAIHLEKRIPVGAGLGGGSSDAGAMLRLLDQLFENPLGEDGLSQVGATLGADVPFFTRRAGRGRGRGIGDQLDALDPLPEREILLLMPQVQVPTSDAYSWLAGHRREHGHDAQPLSDASVDLGWDGLSEIAHNDFQSLIAAETPAVADALSALRSAGAAPVLMSGSGSAVFGVLSDDREEADATEEAVRAGLSEKGPAVRVERVTTMAELPAAQIR